MGKIVKLGLTLRRLVSRLRTSQRREVFRRQTGRSALSIPASRHGRPTGLGCVTGGVVLRQTRLIRGGIGRGSGTECREIVWVKTNFTRRGDRMVCSQIRRCRIRWEEIRRVGRLLRLLRRLGMLEWRVLLLLLLLCLLLACETSLEWIARVLLRSLDVIRRRLGHDTLSPVVSHRVTRHDVPGRDGVWIWLPEGCVQGGSWAQVGWTLGWLTWG